MRFLSVLAQACNVYEVMAADYVLILSCIAAENPHPAFGHLLPFAKPQTGEGRVCWLLQLYAFARLRLRKWEKVPKADEGP